MITEQSSDSNLRLLPTYKMYLVTPLDAALASKEMLM